MYCYSVLQDLHNHPDTQKTKITDLNDYRPVALTSVLMKSFECLILCSAPSLAVHLQSQPGLCIMPSTWVSITFTNIWTLLGLMQGFCLWTHSRTAGKQAGPLQPEYVTGLQTFSQTGSSMGGWKVTCLAPWPWGSTRVCAFPFALLIIPKWLHL